MRHRMNVRELVVGGSFAELCELEGGGRILDSG